MTWFKRGSSKAGNIRVELDGYSFASKLEAAVYQLLKTRMMAGEISDIACQVQVHLSEARVIYKPDFRCTRPDGTEFYTEAKGYKNMRWPTIKKLWRTYGPGDLEIFEGAHTRPVLIEIIKPRREK